MSVTVTGRYPSIERKPTGLVSLDIALSHKGEVGFPTRTIAELYGHPNAGKSTLTYYLAAVLAGTKKIHVCDIEQLDKGYLESVLHNAGYSGEVKVSDVVDEKGNYITHEKMIAEMTANLYNSEFAVSVLDSIGAIQPIAEMKGDFGEAFMGKRAKLVAQVARALAGVLRTKEDAANAFVINHVHGVMGGRGHSTPGGDTMKFLAAVRIYMWTEKVWRLTDENDSELLGFQVKGQVEKLRYGGRGKTFQFFIVPGYGVHTGASAMFDCFEYGLADQGATVKVDGKSLGYIRKDLLTYAAQGKQRKFNVFREKLEEHVKEVSKEYTNEPDGD